MKHFLFYMGVAAVIGIAIGIAKTGLGWSNGLTFAIAVVAGTISSTMAVRESLFEGFRRPASKRRHSRHA